MGALGRNPRMMGEESDKRKHEEVLFGVQAGLAGDAPRSTGLQGIHDLDLPPTLTNADSRPGKLGRRPSWGREFEPGRPSRLSLEPRSGLELQSEGISSQLNGSDIVFSDYEPSDLSQGLDSP